MLLFAGVAGLVGDDSWSVQRDHDHRFCFAFLARAFFHHFAPVNELES